MKLNIIIPTYNRAESLRQTLQSFARADKPDNLEVKITVVNNNSCDNTVLIYEEVKSILTDYEFEYLFEKKQGRSFALNSGIKKADGDLISAIDDDEQIAADWLIEVEKVFRERWDEIDFVGGKILPIWETEPPVWVEPLKDGVICWRDYGDEEWIYQPETPMITGGHGIFKAQVFRDIGLYEEAVGAVGKGFISGEDEVFYDQLLNHGKRGIYHPKLVIFHFVPAYRLDKNYYRRWLFGVGVSRHLADLHYKPFDGVKLFGLPRWMYRTAVGKVFEKLKFILQRKETEALAAEKVPIVLAGYFYGRHLQNGRFDKPLQRIFGGLFKSHQR